MNTYPHYNNTDVSPTRASDAYRRRPTYDAVVTAANYIIHRVVLRRCLHINNDVRN